ncbi:MAG: DEAD/DEAH box helicase [Minisyncoccales bacterium]
MEKTINIDIDRKKSRFILVGNTSIILKNDRLLVSLKRIGFELEGEKISIPYKEESQIATLQNLEDVLQKFGFIDKLSQETKDDVKNFEREQRMFKEFSDRAMAIRNNKFKDRTDLIQEFNIFQTTLREKMHRTLYPLQLLSAYHMAFSQNSCNFSVPGAGKTSIVYGAYSYLNNLAKDNDKYVNKLLIIGPLSSFAPWENEYMACFGKKADVKRLSGDTNIARSQKEQHLYSGNPAEITLISHGGVNNLKKEIVDFLITNRVMVVVDEAHRIKNPDGVWGKSIVDIAREAKARIILTGTPVPNGYEDLFNLFQYLYPYKYKEILNLHYANLAEMTKRDDPDSKRVRNFVNNISPYFIRIKKKDLKLPPIGEQIIEVEMGSHQREIYDFIETKYIKSFMKNSSATIKDVLNKAKLIRLRQAATNPALLQKTIEENLDEDDLEYRSYERGQMPEEFQDGSEILAKINNYSGSEIPGKFLEVKRILSKDILPVNGKAIIWTIFIQNAKELKKYLLEQNIKSELLIGEVDQIERETIIKKFNDPANSEFGVVIANPYAVAESISLHKGCHNAIYLERDYNCSNFLQSKDRIHRVGLAPGQKTSYYYVLSSDSIDEVINRQLNVKVERMEKIIDEDIPLFSRVDENDETDLIKALMDDYAKRA